jgi:hypothetical protein
MDAGTRLHFGLVTTRQDPFFPATSAGIIKIPGALLPFLVIRYPSYRVPPSNLNLLNLETGNLHI